VPGAPDATEGAPVNAGLNEGRGAADEIGRAGSEACAVVDADEMEEVAVAFRPGGGG
jgi:hypothetical protein